MNRSIRFLFVVSACCTNWFTAGVATVTAQDKNSAATNQSNTPQSKPKSVEEELERAKRKVAGPTYELIYKFSPGEHVRWKVVQRVTVETKISGVLQTAKTVSASTKLWKVKEVNKEGHVIFDHFVEEVDMWQSVTGRDEIRYQSKTDKEAPPEYQHVADAVGKSLATVMLTPQGLIAGRDNPAKQFNPGIGELAIPVPAQPIKVRTKWYMPEELMVRTSEGRVKKINTRQRYQLMEVKGDIAVIDVKTEVLTPVEDPKIQSQLVQRLTQGEVLFDIKAGRVKSKTISLDETVLNFQGSDSSMHYVSQLTESLQTSDSSEEKPTPEVAAKPQQEEAKK